MSGMSSPFVGKHGRSARTGTVAADRNRKFGRDERRTKDSHARSARQERSGARPPRRTEDGAAVPLKEGDKGTDGTALTLLAAPRTVRRSLSHPEFLAYARECR